MVGNRMRHLVAVALVALAIGLAVPVEAGSNWFQGKNRIERLERQVDRLQNQNVRQDRAIESLNDRVLDLYVTVECPSGDEPDTTGRCKTD